MNSRYIDGRYASVNNGSLGQAKRLARETNQMMLNGSGLRNTINVTRSPPPQINIYRKRRKSQIGE
jgi:hypothetical protein